MITQIPRTRAEKLWTACVAPELITIADIDTIFFGEAESERYSTSMKPGDFMIVDARKNRDTICDVDDIDDPEAESEARSDCQEDKIPIVVVSNIDRQSDVDTLKQDLLYAGYGVATAPEQTKVKTEPEASDPEAGNEWRSYRS
ncbi:hypothetical protein R1flu_023417 [Riccia fluitans]|uniref:Uncharacterized protein n=1 Tax=Riccia fluitans TaxID=41844 RepID=A0ABD1XSH6_9MARC